MRSLELDKRPSGGGVAELGLVVAGFAALTIAFTYPLAFHLGSIGYKVHVVGDGQYSIWNVAWVAHALLTDPLHVLDANIFYPHPLTLIYSEANLVAGALGTPVFWLTGGNPYATHNFVVLLSFVLSATGTYYLVRYLVGDRRAAVVAAIGFAYCPYAFSRLSHIQLLMTAGIPFSLLAYHRLADRPGPARGAALGLAMGLQTLACAYYGIFVVLLIGLTVLITAAAQSLWRDRRYWVGLATAAVIALALVLPLFLPYQSLQRETGFGRALDESRSYSATWRTYLRSGAYLSSTLQPARPETDTTYAPDETDVLFPGFITALFGVAGLVVAWRAGGRLRQAALLYGAIGVLAGWESFGPAAGLYGLTYRMVPAFSFLRAPSRFGVIVVFALSVLSAVAIAALLRRSAKPAAVFAALLIVASVEHVSGFRFTAAPPVEPVYRLLATLPRGALLEMPPYSAGKAFIRTQYMMNSTVHWMPLVNAYSDYTPPDFSRRLTALGGFPSRAGFDALPDGVRYVTFHLEEYTKNGILDDLTSSLEQFAPYLRRVFGDDRIWLYEVTGRP